MRTSKNTTRDRFTSRAFLAAKPVSTPISRNNHPLLFLGRRADAFFGYLLLFTSKIRTKKHHPMPVASFYHHHHHHPTPLLPALCTSHLSLVIWKVCIVCSRIKFSCIVSLFDFLVLIDSDCLVNFLKSCLLSLLLDWVFLQ
jgi:hypothetical protein